MSGRRFAGGVALRLRAMMVRWQFHLFLLLLLTIVAGGTTPATAQAGVTLGPDVVHGRMMNSGSPNWTTPVLEESAQRNDWWMTNPWWVDKTRRIHEANPEARILAYHNAIAAKWDAGNYDDGSGRMAVAAGVTYDEALARHPSDGHGGPDDWFIHDEQNNHIQTNWDVYHMNPRKSSYQEAWRERVAGQVRDGDFDGIFMDDVNVTGNWKTRPVEFPTDADLQDAMREFLDATVPYLKANGVDLVIPNIGDWNQDPDAAETYIARTDGGFEEHFSDFHSFSAVRRQVEVAQENGKLFWGAIGSGESEATNQQLRYGQGIALLFSQGRAFVSSRDAQNEQWCPCYDDADQLGAPVEPAHQDSSNVWRRSFENGWVTVRIGITDATVHLD